MDDKAIDRKMRERPAVPATAEALRLVASWELGEIDQRIEWAISRLTLGSIPGAINWADLHVVNVGLMVSNNDDTTIVVRVEEAAPEAAYKLWEAIREEVYFEFTPSFSIEFTTEW